MTENGLRRAEILGDNLDGSTTFGPVQFSSKYLGRTYAEGEIIITVVCKDKTRVYRNKTRIFIPARGEKEIDTDSFDEQ